MKPTRLVLIRHGLTQWNKIKRYCGCRDIGISKEGRLQAEKLSCELAAVGFDVVYSSEKKRALQTARIVFKGAKIKKVRGLNELNFGILEGLRYDEIMRKCPDEYEAWLKDPFKNSIPKAEPLNLFKKRVISAINKIVSFHSGETVGVVCHGGTIAVFIMSLRKSRDFWGNIPGGCSFSVVEYRNNKPKIKKFNQVKHLR